MKRGSVILLLIVSCSVFLFLSVEAFADQKVLGVPWDFQHKDTNMLCLEGDPEIGDHPWDAPHLRHDIHGTNYCCRAATSMIAQYYLNKHAITGHLSQDRISYQINYKWRIDGLPPDYAFKHGNTSPALEWALDVPSLDNCSGSAFSVIKGYIDNDRPMVAAWSGHCRVIDGYSDTVSGQFVHIQDPWPLAEPDDADKWMNFTNIPGSYYCGAAPANAPGVRKDENAVWLDSDSDGIVDFDEVERFNTDPYDYDTDNDFVPDKEDMREYLFDEAGNYGPPAFLQRMHEELALAYPAETPEGDIAVLVSLFDWSPITPYTAYNLNTGDHLPPDSWDYNWPVINKVIERADFDGDGLRKELDPDNDNDGYLDGQEDTNHNGIFEPQFDETDNFNPDVITPVTSKTVGNPHHTDSGKFCINSNTGHTLSASDTGPSGFTGIRGSYYRYFLQGMSPVNYSEYSSPFVMTGADGPYVVEYYSKDLAGNKESAHSQIEWLDNSPPEITCPADKILECSDPNTDPSNSGTATATDMCDSDPLIQYTDEINLGTCQNTSTIIRTWEAQDDLQQASECPQTISIVDTTPPVIDCNTTGTIDPSDVTIQFTSIATDNCDEDPSVVITGYDCFMLTKKGKSIDKTKSCSAAINGATITILDSGGVDNNITWTVQATDCSGNESTKVCILQVINPAQ